MGLLKKLFGTTSEREVKAISPIVDKIEALDAEYSALTDDVELKLDAADQAAAMTDIRYSGDEVFKRARERIRGKETV